jgi:hypothetical protein
MAMRQKNPSTLTELLFIIPVIMGLFVLLLWVTAWPIVPALREKQNFAIVILYCFSIAVGFMGMVSYLLNERSKMLSRALYAKYKRIERKHNRVVGELIDLIRHNSPCLDSEIEAYMERLNSLCCEKNSAERKKLWQEISADALGLKDIVEIYKHHDLFPPLHDSEARELILAEIRENFENIAENIPLIPEEGLDLPKKGINWVGGLFGSLMANSIVFTTLSLNRKIFHLSEHVVTAILLLAAAILTGFMFAIFIGAKEEDHDLSTRLFPGETAEEEHGFAKKTIEKKLRSNDMGSEEALNEILSIYKNIDIFPSLKDSDVRQLILKKIRTEEKDESSC